MFILARVWVQVVDGGERPCHECVHVCACGASGKAWVSPSGAVYLTILRLVSLTALGFPRRWDCQRAQSFSSSHPPLWDSSTCHYAWIFFLKYGFWRLNSGSNICKSSILLNELCPQAPNSNFYYIKTNVKNSFRIITVVVISLGSCNSTLTSSLSQTSIFFYINAFYLIFELISSSLEYFPVGNNSFVYSGREMNKIFIYFS